MSTWKKASKSNQKTHRERSQPEHRTHLGLLEKKKDYKRRAENEHEKETTLKLLRKRALDKNEDEFYHHMINAQIEDGEHREKHKKDENSEDQIKLMQSQDIKYVTMKKTMETNKIRRMQSSLHMIDSGGKVKNTHTFFVDGEEDLKKFDLARRLDTHPSLIDRKANRLKMSDLAKIQLPDISESQLQKMSSEREKQYNELSRRIERERELTITQQKLEMKRTLQQSRKLTPMCVAKGTKESAPIYQFKYERKR